MVAVNKENLYVNTTILAKRFSLGITKVHNTEETGSIPVQRMLEIFQH